MLKRITKEQENDYQSGADRRYNLMVLIAKRELDLGGLPVNNKWQMSTRNPDIQYLLKKGLIKRIRKATKPCRNLVTGLKKPSKGQTYLVLVKPGE